MNRRVWLVRHGESTANAGQPSQDPSGIDLTELGRRQAEAVAAIVPEPPSLIVASWYRRARLTAQPTARRFPTAPLEVWDVQEFTYLGSLHGRRLTNVERAPFADSYWRRANPYLVDRPELGSESFAGLLDRAERFLARLDQTPSGLVMVFSHHMFIRAVDWCLRARAGTVTRLDMAGYREHHRRSPVPNGSVIELGEHDTELREPAFTPAPLAAPSRWETIAAGLAAGERDGRDPDRLEPAGLEPSGLRDRTGSPSHGAW